MVVMHNDESILILRCLSFEKWLSKPSKKINPSFIVIHSLLKYFQERILDE